MHKAECTAPECEHGWKFVGADYALRHAKRPPFLDAPPGPDQTRAQAAYDQQLASWGDSVYPCKVCNTTAFMRWAGGHQEPDHRRDECDECEEVRRGRRPAARADNPYTPTPRRDLA